MEKTSLVRGCLLGGAVGDALGAPIEFMSLTHIKQMYGPHGVTGYREMDDHGYITDDTQMTLFTAEGILLSKERGSDPVKEVFYAYERWLVTQGVIAPPSVPQERLEDGTLHLEGKLQEQRAPGSTCLSSLMRRRDSIYDPEQKLNNSKGCGTVMRMSPVGLLYEPEDAFRYGKIFSALTHGHPTGYLSGAAAAMLFSLVFRGVELRRGVQEVLSRLESEPGHHETSGALRAALNCVEDACLDVAEALPYLGEGWVAEEALAISVYCALKFKGDFRGGVLAAVNITGDSDSTGAITGGLLGASLGVEAIPEEWLDDLYERDVVEDVCEQVRACLE